MPLKGLSFEEIVKKEMSEGKDQKQAVAIAYSVTGKSKDNNLSSRERFDSLDNRMRRGTERYAAKPMRYGEDEASAEEHELQKEELVRKKQNTLAKKLKVGDIVMSEQKEKRIARIGRNPNGTLDVVFEGGGSMFLEPGDDVDTV